MNSEMGRIRERKAGWGLGWIRSSAFVTPPQTHEEQRQRPRHNAQKTPPQTRTRAHHNDAIQSSNGVPSPNLNWSYSVGFFSFRLSFQSNHHHVANTRQEGRRHRDRQLQRQRRLVRGLQQAGGRREWQCDSVQDLLMAEGMSSWMYAPRDRRLTVCMKKDGGAAVLRVHMSGYHVLPMVRVASRLISFSTDTRTR